MRIVVNDPKSAPPFSPKGRSLWVKQPILWDIWASWALHRYSEAYLNTFLRNCF